VPINASANLASPYERTKTGVPVYGGAYNHTPPPRSILLMSSAYAFNLHQVCGGFAYFSTYTLGSAVEDRFEVRTPRIVDANLFEQALHELGHTARKIHTERAFEYWLQFHGWAIVELAFARSQMSHWLQRQQCIHSPYGTFTDKAIASPKALDRTLRGKAKQRILERDGRECLLCGDTKGLTLQHVLPHSGAAETTSRNLITLCGPCNEQLKNEYHPDLFRLANLHYGFEPSLIGAPIDIDRAIIRARQFSHNLMFTRCDLW